MISSELPPSLIEIVNKVTTRQRLDANEALELWQNCPLGLMAEMANNIRELKNNKYVYFNKNIHLEPTNLCVFTCEFCSYSRTLKEHEDGWFMSKEAILDEIKKHDDKAITEVHIVGGVHPKLTLDFFVTVLESIKKHRPELHIKAFTAVELDYMFRKAKVNNTEGFEILKKAGLDSIPGGGAEIFDPEIRNKICPDKCDAIEWLAIHKAAHSVGMKSNATMLYGHYENYEHRIDHLMQLRQLQDETHGFNTFIPLKFRNQNNAMHHLVESTVIEDLKTYAMSRILLDNFDHIKAYWPMIGKETAQLSLQFGVDDLDGTIDDTTKIYSMAGSEEQNPVLSTFELANMIKSVNLIPIERDTLYNVITDYSKVDTSIIKAQKYLSLPVLN